MTETIIAATIFTFLSLGIFILLVRVDRLRNRVEENEITISRSEMEKTREDQSLVEGYKNLRRDKFGLRKNYEDWDDLTENERRSAGDDLETARFLEKIKLAEEKSRSESRIAASLASETKLSKGHDLESYKDLSAGKYKRFSSNDLDEVSEYLTTKQRKQIGG